MAKTIDQISILMKEWDYRKNDELGLIPTKISCGSDKKCWWKCPLCDNSYYAAANHRVNGTRCPYCAKVMKTSYPEQLIYFYIKKLFDDSISRYKIGDIEVDIYIPTRNIAIEYDGMRFHNSKEALEREQKKYQKLKSLQIILIRIKEGINKANHNNNADYVISVEKPQKSSQFVKALIELVNVISNISGEKYEMDIDIDRDRMEVYSQYLISRKENSLLNKYPNVADEWNYTKNLKIKPSMVDYSSSMRVWWKCKKGHEWQASCNTRTGEHGHGCPYCANQKVLKGYNDFATINPEFLSEWDYKKNKYGADEIISGSNKKVWWICQKGHSYEASPNSRCGVKHAGCPYCSNKKILVGYNDFATTNFKLLNEWDYERNDKLGIYPTDITKGSSKKVWWKCAKGHEWFTQVKVRSRGDKCPVCTNRKIMSGINDLRTLNSKLISEWNYERNNELDIYPETIALYSNKRVWWKCKKGHEWCASINSRASGRSCPICSKISGGIKHTQLLIERHGSLKNNNQDLLVEWDYEKNDALGLEPSKITSGSHKKAWWICKTCGNTWETEIRLRALKNYKCPKCHNRY